MQPTQPYTFFDNFTLPQDFNLNAIEPWDPSWGPYATDRGSSNYNCSINITYGPGLYASYIADNPDTYDNQIGYFYTGDTYLDSSQLQYVTFYGCRADVGGSTINFMILDDQDNILGQSGVIPLDIIGSNVTVDCTGNPYYASQLLILDLKIYGDGTNDTIGYYIDSFNSDVTCLAEGSSILMANGQEKKIELIKRGDQVQGGQVARLIKEKVPAQQQVDMVRLSPHCLGPRQPHEETLVCGDHWLIHEGKRRMARSLLALPGVKRAWGRARDILPHQQEEIYLYDLQFDCEGSYTVNGLTSQSRSPYARVSPLAKELYFDQANYKEVRVPNTLTEDPPLSYNYLLPDGSEVESFVSLVPKDK